MVSRNNRDSKADATHHTAMKIVETERERARLKTDRLRAARLVLEGKGELPAAAPRKKKK